MVCNLGCILSLRRGLVYTVSWKRLVPEGKNLARASRLRTWTAKSPASIIVQPSFVFCFEFWGSVTGGEDWSNLMVNAIYASEAPEIRDRWVFSPIYEQHVPPLQSRRGFLFLPLPIEPSGLDGDEQIVNEYVEAYLSENNPIPQPSNRTCGNTLPSIRSPSPPPAFGHSVGKGRSRRRRYWLTNQKFGLVQVGGSLQSSVETFDYCRNTLWKWSRAILNDMRGFLPHEGRGINEPGQLATRRCRRSGKLATTERGELPQQCQ